MFNFLVIASIISLAHTCTTVNGVTGACDLRLNEFAFAGANNAGAGAYGVLWYWTGVAALSCFYRHQNKNITEQLELGIRYFDFDTAYINASSATGWWEEGIVMVDGDAYSKSLKHALTEIDNFLGEHEDEIVVIRLKNHSAWAREAIKSTLQDEFSIFNNTQLNGERNPRLGDAIDRNWRVFVFVNEEFGRQCFKPVLEQVESVSHAGATVKCWEVNEIYDMIMSDERVTDEYYQVQVNWFYTYGLCIHELASLCDGEELYKIREINRLLRESTGRGVNLVLIDYVGSGDVRLADVMKKINEENVKYIADKKRKLGTKKL